MSDDSAKPRRWRRPNIQSTLSIAAKIGKEVGASSVEVTGDGRIRLYFDSGGSVRLTNGAAYALETPLDAWRRASGEG